MTGENMESFVSDHATVNYSGVDKKWAKAFSEIYESARQGYIDVFGILLPERVTIEITVTGEKTQLWTDGEGAFFLKLEREEDLLPSSPYRNIYGFCHEPGHIVMYSRMKSTSGLPDGVGEGWAHYAGCVITDYVWEHLGKDVYPVPFDYSVFGTKRLDDAAGKPSDDAVTVASNAFYALGKNYGHRAVGDAMLAALKDKPSGSELMPRFKAAVLAMLGEDAAAMLPESILTVKLKWESQIIKQGVAPPASFFKGLKRDKDGWLKYNDGTNEGMRSTAGGGHAVIFRAPGGGKLAKVRLFGARYGPAQSNSVFNVYILDNSFKEIASFEFPYMIFDERSGDALYWREFDMKNTPVPEVFFVCFVFEPTATDGVYVGIDKSSTGHSFGAAPGSYLGDLDEGDWMVEAEMSTKQRQLSLFQFSNQLFLTLALARGKIERDRMVSGRL